MRLLRLTSYRTQITTEHLVIQQCPTNEIDRDTSVSIGHNIQSVYSYTTEGVCSTSVLNVVTQYSLQTSHSSRTHHSNHFTTVVSSFAYQSFQEIIEYRLSQFSSQRQVSTSVVDDRPTQTSSTISFTLRTVENTTLRESIFVLQSFCKTTQSNIVIRTIPEVTLPLNERSSTVTTSLCRTFTTYRSVSKVSARNSVQSGFTVAQTVS